MDNKREVDDAALVKSLSGGNILAFNTLFRGYSSRLYHFAFGYLKSDVESEEVVQEVFTIVWEKRHTLKENLSFRSYLFTIAYNIIKKHFRARSYLREYINTAKIKDDLDMATSQEIDFSSLQGFVTELIEGMPERRTEIFIKSRIEGLSIREIADSMKISHKTVENQISTALKYIRNCLKNEKLQAVLFISLFII